VRSAPTRPSAPDWLGAFTGTSSDGSARLGLLVQEDGIRFLVEGPSDPMSCRATLSGGIKSSMYRISLECGGDMALAGADARISIFWSGDRWRVDGSGVLSGLNGVLSRR